MPDSFDLVVTVQYYGSKAQNFYSGSYRAIALLREDLLALKLPHPKANNVIIKALPGGQGECSFMWPSVPFKQALHKNLTTRIYGSDTVGSRKQLLKELSICRLSLWESPAGTVILDPQSNAWRTKDGSRLIDARSRVQAQMLLDDMATALIHPKTEPIEPTLPDSPIATRDSEASFIPSLPATAPQWGVNNTTRQRDSQSPMSLSSSRHSTPRPIKVLVESPVIPTLPLPPHDSEPMPPGLAFSMRQSNWVRNNTQLPSPSTTTSRKRSRSNSPDIWTRRPPPGATAPSINKGPSALKAEELKRELLNVRREIEAGVIREASIIAKIRALGSSAPTREMPEETVLRERLKVVEAELLAETKLRLEAEAVLMDFQTECKEPFLVPAMFDMVDTISRLTTQALELIKAEGG